MIGDGGNGSAELGADLRVLGVGVGETGGVVEDIGDQLVDGVLGNVVAGEDDRADGDGDGVRIKTVNILADGDLGVVRGRGKQLVDVLIIERDKIDVLGRRKVSDCRCRSTRNDEGRVDLAVFRESALSPKDWYVGLISCSVRPYAPSTSMALKYTPEPAAPMETFLPLRSSTDLISGSVVTICTCSV